MPEFKFPCPACRQFIRCDAGYIGTRVDCPLCQQAIVVPPRSASRGERVIEIRKSTLKKSALIALGVLLAVLLVELAIHFIPFGPKTLNFKGYVDGTDVLKISGRRLWLEHLAWQHPKQISINGGKWNPVWSADSSPTFPEWNDNKTRPYTLNRPFKPTSPDSIRLTKKAGRGVVTIIQKPTPENEQTLAIQIDDGPYSGADSYELTVSW